MIDILLVDDETYVTESLAATIPWEKIGVRFVHQASSAQEAISLLEETSIDIVVTDIQMPDMSGLQLIEAISRSWPNIRCILLTGHNQFDYAKKAVRLQAVDYLLKPVNDDEFMASVSNAAESLREEWEQSDKLNQLMYHRKSDFTVLRANLLHDLVLGRSLSLARIQERLEQYELSLKVEEEAVLLLLQLGRQFSHYDLASLSLMEFAIGNIAEEVFREQYHIWHAKAPHEFMVLVISLKDPEGVQGSEAQRDRRRRLAENVATLQKHVSHYLKGDISVVVTDWFSFPAEISGAYRSGLSTYYRRHQDKSGTVLYAGDQAGDKISVHSIESLYKPPTLIHLLESKQWEAAEERIREVIADLDEEGYSREHLYEVFLAVSNAFLYTSHKQGQSMFTMDHSIYDFMLEPAVIHSREKLLDWAVGTLVRLKEQLSESDHHTRGYIIRQVQEMVSKDLGQDTSVKTIADRIYLHPVYLSKVYRSETGESLGDYIIRMRMEKALYLLKHTNMKIYEITSELGYQNPQYFSKMFKKFYGMTPNEFRDH